MPVPFSPAPIQLARKNYDGTPVIGARYGATVELIIILFDFIKARRVLIRFA